MIKITISEADIEEAKKLFDFKKLNNSITSGEGNLSGALGEILVCKYFNGRQENTFDYDLIIRDTKIDVKTKRYTAGLTPNINWNLNIPDFNTTQKCDYYCFIGLSDKHDVAYIYGFINKEQFYNIAIFGKSGEIDPQGNGTWKYRADCYNILVKQLSIDF